MHGARPTNGNVTSYDMNYLITRESNWNISLECNNKKIVTILASLHSIGHFVYHENLPNEDHKINDSDFTSEMRDDDVKRLFD